jgi:signal transduction histidine kinase
MAFLRLAGLGSLESIRGRYFEESYASFGDDAFRRQCVERFNQIKSELKTSQVIYGDDVRIRQIITNLVNNAIKYTKKGYVDFKICRRVFHDRGCLAVIVKDTGIGIKKEDFPKLFGTFQQLDRENNRSIMGMGLGLAITKNPVDMMKGELFFDSVYGEGAGPAGEERRCSPKDSGAGTWCRRFKRHRRRQGHL